MSVGITNELKNVMQYLHDSVRCPICRRTFTNPARSLECDHIFCNDCLLAAMRATKECPLCKKRIPTRRSIVKEGPQIEMIKSVLELFKCYNKDLLALSEENREIMIIDSQIPAFTQAPPQVALRAIQKSSSGRSKKTKATPMATLRDINLDNSDIAYKTDDEKDETKASPARPSTSKQLTPKRDNDSFDDMFDSPASRKKGQDSDNPDLFTEARSTAKGMLDLFRKTMHRVQESPQTSQSEVDTADEEIIRSRSPSCEIIQASSSKSTVSSRCPNNNFICAGVSENSPPTDSAATLKAQKSVSFSQLLFPREKESTLMPESSRSNSHDPPKNKIPRNSDSEPDKDDTANKSTLLVNVSPQASVAAVGSKETKQSEGPSLEDKNESFRQCSSTEDISQSKKRKLSASPERVIPKNDPDEIKLFSGKLQSLVSTESDGKSAAQKVVELLPWLIEVFPTAEEWHSVFQAFPGNSSVPVPAESMKNLKKSIPENSKSESSSDEDDASYEVVAMRTRSGARKASPMKMDRTPQKANRNLGNSNREKTSSKTENSQDTSKTKTTAGSETDADATQTTVQERRRSPRKAVIEKRQPTPSKPFTSPKKKSETPKKSSSAVASKSQPPSEIMNDVSVNADASSRASTSQPIQHDERPEQAAMNPGPSENNFFEMKNIEKNPEQLSPSPTKSVNLEITEADAMEIDVKGPELRFEEILSQPGPDQEKLLERKKIVWSWEAEDARRTIGHRNKKRHKSIPRSSEKVLQRNLSQQDVQNSPADTAWKSSTLLHSDVVKSVSAEPSSARAPRITDPLRLKTNESIHKNPFRKLFASSQPLAAGPSTVEKPVSEVRTQEKLPDATGIDRKRQHVEPNIETLRDLWKSPIAKEMGIQSEVKKSAAKVNFKSQNSIAKSQTETHSVDSLSQGTTAALLGAVHDFESALDVNSTQQNAETSIASAVKDHVSPEEAVQRSSTPVETHGLQSDDTGTAVKLRKIDGALKKNIFAALESPVGAGREDIQVYTGLTSSQMEKCFADDDNAVSNGTLIAQETPEKLQAANRRPACNPPLPGIAEEVPGTLDEKGDEEARILIAAVDSTDADLKQSKLIQTNSTETQSKPANIFPDPTAAVPNHKHSVPTEEALPPEFLAEKFKICISGFGTKTSDQLRAVMIFCKKFGVTVSKEMTPDVACLVVANPGGQADRCDRTLKYIRALTLRKWIVSHSWAIRCREQKRIVHPCKFEISGSTSETFARIPMLSRTGPPLFQPTSAVFIFLGEFKYPTKETLIDIAKSLNVKAYADVESFKSDLMGAEPSRILAFIDNVAQSPAVVQVATDIQRFSMQLLQVEWLFMTICSRAEADHYKYAPKKLSQTISR